MRIRLAAVPSLLFLLLLAGCTDTPTVPAGTQPVATAAVDPLPSWNDGAPKQAIVDFVKTTTYKGSPKFVQPEDRIATFDQDGTTWVEQPMYSQVLFAFDRVAELAPQHPGWKTKQPFKAILTGDKETMSKFSTKGIELVFAEKDRAC